MHITTAFRVFLTSNEKKDALQPSRTFHYLVNKKVYSEVVYAEFVDAGFVDAGFVTG